jgi:hypothetical protein
MSHTCFCDVRTFLVLLIELSTSHLSLKRPSTTSRVSYQAAYKYPFEYLDSIWAASFDLMSSVTATLGGFASQYIATPLRVPKISPIVLLVTQ